MKKIVSATLATLIASTTFAANAQEQSSLARFQTQLEQLVEQNNAALWADLAINDAMIHSIESANFFNELLDLDRTNIVIGLVGTAFVTAVSAGTIYLADGLVKVVTPEKSAWYAGYKKTLIAEKNAHTALAEAEARFVANGLVVREELRTAVATAQRDTAQFLLKKPGNIYKTARFVRGAARFSILLGGSLTIGAVSFAEGTLLIIKTDQMDAILSQLKERRNELKAILL